jgi:hypothetical protein
VAVVVAADGVVVAVIVVDEGASPLLTLRHWVEADGKLDLDLWLGIASFAQHWNNDKCATNHLDTT